MKQAAFPFADLLAYLKQQGFTIGVDHYLRLQTLLNLLGPDCPPEALKNLLCPIFAVNEKQQRQFHAAFHRFVPLLEAAAPKTPAPEKPPDPSDRPPRARRWPYFLLGLLVLVLVFWLIPSQPPQTTSLTNVEIPAGRVISEIVGDVDILRGGKLPAVPARVGDQVFPGDLLRTASQSRAQLTFADGNVIELAPETRFDLSKDAILPPAPAPEVPAPFTWTRLRPVALALPTILFVGTALWRRQNRRLVLERQRQRGKRKRPPYVWPIRCPGPELGFLKDETFLTAARRLQLRRPSDVYQLDVATTVALTARAAGFPELRYRALTKPPEYLVLVDLAAPRDHQAQLADRIVAALQDEGVFVSPYFYSRDPRVCFQTHAARRVFLSDLKGRYRDYRLLVFGDGEEFLDPVSGDLEGWVSLFQAWPDRVLLSPTPPGHWGWREETLDAEFLVLPATLAGLAAVADHLAGLAPASGADLPLSGGKTRELPDAAGQDVGALRSALGADVFQWLCACAVFPQLHYDLTLHLGSLPEMPAGLLTEANLLALFRLDWFRQGSIPDEVRFELITQLDPEQAAAVRSAVVGVLEDNPPPGGTFAWDTWHLNLVLQRWLLAPRERRRRQDLAALPDVVGDQAVLEDYAVVRVMDTAPSSPLKIILPSRLQALFCRHGLPLFGLRTAVHAGLAVLATVLIYFFFNTESVIQPPKDAKIPISAPLTETPSQADKKAIRTPMTKILPLPADMKPITNRLGMTFVPIPAGTFQMGSPAGEKGRDNDEWQHQVTISKPFYLQTTEVTQGQWQAVMGANPSDFKECGKDCPVENVSWQDAQKFIKKLNEMGKTDAYRLPTEAEWEWAARAGSATAFHFGDDTAKVPEYAWFVDNSRRTPHPVGQKKPNAWGLYDMHGNVWEWVQDCYGGYYGSGPAVDPQGPAYGDRRVLRGGSWDNGDWYLRSAARYGRDPGYRFSYIGFRVARTFSLRHMP